jgi:hypothetical protein
VKKVPVSGNLGSSEQGSAWLVVEATVDDGKAAAAAVQMLAARLGASVRTGSPTGGSRTVFDFS